MSVYVKKFLNKKGSPPEKFLIATELCGVVGWPMSKAWQIYLAPLKKGDMDGDK